jgi:hypothetical protein
MSLASSNTNYTAIGVLLAIFIPICAATAIIVWTYLRLQRHRADAVAMTAYRKLAEEAGNLASQADTSRAPREPLSRADPGRADTARGAISTCSAAGISLVRQWLHCAIVILDRSAGSPAAPLRWRDRVLGAAVHVSSLRWFAGGSIVGSLNPTVLGVQLITVSGTPSRASPGAAARVAADDIGSHRCCQRRARAGLCCAVPAVTRAPGDRGHGQ